MGIVLGVQGLPTLVASGGWAQTFVVLVPIDASWAAVMSAADGVLCSAALAVLRMAYEGRTSDRVHPDDVPDGGALPAPTTTRLETK